MGWWQSLYQPRVGSKAGGWLSSRDLGSASRRGWPPPPGCCAAAEYTPRCMSHDAVNAASHSKISKPESMPGPVAGPEPPQAPSFPDEKLPSAPACTEAGLPGAADRSGPSMGTGGFRPCHRNQRMDKHFSEGLRKLLG